MNGDKIEVDGIKGLMASAKDIDKDGVWTSAYGKMSLLGKEMPVPKNLQRGKGTEMVLAILPANQYVTKCTCCKVDFDKDVIILVMESARLIPAHCCNMMLWSSEIDG